MLAVAGLSQALGIEPSQAGSLIQQQQQQHRGVVAVDEGTVCRRNMYRFCAPDCCKVKGYIYFLIFKFLKVFLAD